MLEPTTLLIFVSQRTRPNHFVHHRRILGAPGLGEQVGLLGDVYQVTGTTDIWVPAEGSTLINEAARVLQGVDKVPAGIDVRTPKFEDRIPLERVIIVTVK